MATSFSTVGGEYNEDFDAITAMRPDASVAWTFELCGCGGWQVLRLSDYGTHLEDWWDSRYEDGGPGYDGACRCPENEKLLAAVRLADQVMLPRLLRTAR